MSRRPAGREPYPGEIVSYDPQPRLDEARLDELVRMSRHGGGAQHIPELVAALRVERERAERLERTLVELEEMASPSSIEAKVIRRALSAASTQEDE